MKNLSLLFLLFLVNGSHLLYAQSYTPQILNKEQFKSAASLTQDYDGDGDLDIIVTRWEPAGIYWLENDSTRQFPAHAIITENLTFYMADIDKADFDNDGDMDYVVCFTDVNDGELAWFQRQDDGTYQKWTIATNLDFIEADIADFNGDGFTDIAVVGLNNSNETCKVYLNQGNLFFSELVVASENVGDAIDVGDIDGDGDFDIVVTATGSINFMTCEASGSRTFINDGNANFTVGKYLKNGYSWFTSFWETIEITDLNNDGIKDIVSFNSVALGGLVFLDGTNLDDCNSIQGVEIDDDNGVIDIGGHFVVFDIDGNGLLDIVRQGWGEERLSVLYQVSDLSFERTYIELNWDNCCNPTTKMSVGDLDNDGDLDLVFPEQGNVDHDISWFENINGQLFKHQIYGELDGVSVPKMVDWDNDGDLDIFATVASGTIDDTEDELILYENIDGENFINWRLHDALDHAADIEFADIDGDGDPDAFATARDADDLVWLRNDGFQANWHTDTIFAEGNQPLGIATDDIDDDGDADVIMCSWNDDKVLGFRNDGTGSFTPFIVDADIDGPKEVEIADLDNDGDKDIAVVATESSNSVVVYTNDGMENFSEQIIFSGEVGQDIEIGDWNQDGIPDVFACFTGSDVHVVGFIYDNGNYFIDTFPLQNDDVLSLKLTDLDGDTDLDLITGHDESFANLNAALFASIIEEGEIIHSFPLTDEIRSEVYGIDAGDINNDGVVDIIYADFFQDDLVLLTIGCLAAPVPSIATEDATCNENNGTASIDVSIFENPSIEWSNGASSAEITGLEAGTYEVTITDSNGCTVTSGVTIEDVPVAEIAVEGSDTSCGDEDGTASVILLGGANIIAYEWSNGASSAEITGLEAGTYEVTITDSNGCTVASGVTIEDVPVAEIAVEGSDTSCGDEDGTTSVILLGGANIIAYEWSNGSTTASISGLPGGVYTVTVTDENGCEIIESINIEGLENPTVDLGADLSIMEGETATLDASGADLTYEWSTGAMTSMITVNEAGIYSVTVSNVQGCTASDTIIVSIITGIHEPGEAGFLQISPNPAKDVVTIALPGSKGDVYELGLFDSKGRLVKRRKLPPGQLVFDLSLKEIPAGTYLVVLKADNRYLAGRIIKH